MQRSIDTREKLLDRKRDYSPLLVHLTKDSKDINGNLQMLAKDVLDKILKEKTLKAFNHFFPYSPSLKSQDASIIDKFRVVCFTETPIDQIDVLLNKGVQKQFNPEPYGLVFKKEYIREMGGNPVFYATLKIAKPLWEYLYHPHVEGKEQVPDNLCKLLALVTKCQEGHDFHWEREWRIVGNLDFKLNDIYCGLCPQEEMPNFESKCGVKFIDPYWGINKILDKLVGKLKRGG
jgi:hypothetical protein